MFDKIKSLFSNKKTKPATSTCQEEKPCSIPIIKYFEKELRNCKYIKQEAASLVIKHLTHEASLTKTRNTLTVQEKKALGINTRLSITKEFIEILTEEGLALANPKALLEEIYNRANITKSRIDSFTKAVNAGIKKFTLHGAGDNNECEWCKKNFGFEFDHSIFQQMQNNCTCKPYSKCFISPVIKF